MKKRGQLKISKSSPQESFRWQIPDILWTDDDGRWSDFCHCLCEGEGGPFSREEETLSKWEYCEVAKLAKSCSRGANNWSWEANRRRTYDDSLKHEERCSREQRLDSRRRASKSYVSSSSTPFSRNRTLSWTRFYSND